MADRDIETVVDGMETVPLLAADIALLEQVMKGVAQEFSYDEAPLACGCDPETGYKCPEHETRPEHPSRQIDSSEYRGADAD